MEFGEANRALPEQMEYAITEETAAALYVISHMTATSGQLSLPAFAEIAHRHNIPVIVDAAAGAFFAHRLLAEGADAVCFSGHKHLCGFTSGVIAGKRDLVAAAALQGTGIGRAMKPSKEGVVSVIERMEWLANLDYAAWEAGQNAKVDVMVAALQGIPGVNVFAERDVTGNPQTRTKIVVDPACRGHGCRGGVRGAHRRQPAHLHARPLCRRGIPLHRSDHAPPRRRADRDCAPPGSSAASRCSSGVRAGRRLCSFMLRS